MKMSQEQYDKLKNAGLLDPSKLNSQYGTAGAFTFLDQNANPLVSGNKGNWNSPYLEQYVTSGSEGGGGDLKYRYSDQANQIFKDLNPDFEHNSADGAGILQIGDPSQASFGGPGEIKDPSLIKYDPRVGYYVMPQDITPADSRFDDVMASVIFTALSAGAASGGAGILNGLKEAAGTLSEALGTGATIPTVPTDPAYPGDGNPGGSSTPSAPTDPAYPGDGNPGGSPAQATPSGPSPSDANPFDTQQPTEPSTPTTPSVPPEDPAYPGNGNPLSSGRGLIDSAMSAVKSPYEWYNSLSPAARQIIGGSLSLGARAALSHSAQQTAIQAQRDAEERARQDTIRRGQVPNFAPNTYTPAPLAGGLIASHQGGK